eukprot:g2252.t1
MDVKSDARFAKVKSQTESEIANEEFILESLNKQLAQIDELIHAEKVTQLQNFHELLDICHNEDEELRSRHVAEQDVRKDAVADMEIAKALRKEERVMEREAYNKKMREQERKGISERRHQTKLRRQEAEARKRMIKWQMQRQREQILTHNAQERKNRARVSSKAATKYANIKKAQWENILAEREEDKVIKQNWEADVEKRHWALHHSGFLKLAEDNLNRNHNHHAASAATFFAPPSSTSAMDSHSSIASSSGQAHASIAALHGAPASGVKTGTSSSASPLHESVDRVSRHEREYLLDQISRSKAKKKAIARRRRLAEKEIKAHENSVTSTTPSSYHHNHSEDLRRKYELEHLQNHLDQLDVYHEATHNRAAQLLRRRNKKKETIHKLRTKSDRLKAEIRKRLAKLRVKEIQPHSSLLRHLSNQVLDEHSIKSLREAPRSRLPITSLASKTVMETHTRYQGTENERVHIRRTPLSHKSSINLR